MKDSLSVKETAKKWGVSVRWVNQYIHDDRIKGAERLGRAWAIPADAVKPDKEKSRPKSKRLSSK